MNKYNLKDFTKQGNVRYSGIRLNRGSVAISNDLFSLIGKCEYVSLSFDKDKSAIAITPTNDKTFRIRMYGTQQIIPCRLSAEMPIGKYEFKEKIGEAFICITTPPNPPMKVKYNE